MHTHDPFQSYQMLGQYSPSQLPFGQPLAGLYPTLNPIAGAYQTPNPIFGLSNPAIGGGYGNYMNPLQQGLGAQGGYPGPQAGLNPLLGLHNPFIQSPIAQLAWQNPWLAASLQNQFNSPFAQLGGGQQQSPFHYPLAPQTMTGGGIGQPYGQLNPFAQTALRQQTGYGFSPLGGCF